MRLPTKTRSLLRAGLLLLALVYPSTPCVTSTGLAATVTSRSITLSDSTVSATGVNYSVQFTPPSAAQSFIIEFCGDSPIIGASCDQSSSTTTGVPGFAAANATFTNVSGLSNWSYLKSQWRLRFTRNSGSAISAGSTVRFVIGNVTNMQVARTFYARIYTYSDTAYGGASAYASATNPGNYADVGGFAMSTANSIVISARVMESLLFCVSGMAPGTNCSGSTPPDVTLGHGINSLLDSGQVDSATTYAQVSTNAQSGASVTMKSGTTCAGLSSDGGSTCAIAAQNSGSSSGTIGAGSGLFGAGVTGAGGISPTAKYDGAGGKSNYDSSSSSGVKSTYGDTIAAATGPVDGAVVSVTFSASASPTTPAGSYATNIQLTVTGVY